MNRNLVVIDINRNYVDKSQRTAKLRLIRGLAIKLDQSQLHIR